VRDWPGILGTIADDVDPEAALLLAEEYGGRMLFIPLMFARGHRLVELLGSKRASAVREAIGPDYHLVPLGPCAGNEQRHREIARLHVEEKLTAPAIAARVHVHVRTVYRVTALLRELNPDPDPDQIEMFSTP